MKKVTYLFLGILFLAAVSCSEQIKKDNTTASMPLYKDVPYLQDLSIKYGVADSIAPFKVFEDRNNVVQVLSDKGLLRTHDGRFLFPGTLTMDRTYLPMAKKHVTGMATYEGQFVIWTTNLC